MAIGMYHRNERASRTTRNKNTFILPIMSSKLRKRTDQFDNVVKYEATLVAHSSCCKIIYNCELI